MSYERAVSMHTAAREMVYVAEQGLMADGKNTLDPTWQEMLNHATSKVTKRRRSTCYKTMVLNGHVQVGAGWFWCVKSDDTC